MRATLQQIGNQVGLVIPKEFNLKVGQVVELTKMSQSLVLTPVEDGLFDDESDWEGFRDSVSDEDDEWDQLGE